MNFILLLLLFSLGAALGSFLNLCITRLPQEESILFPPSHCPYCQTRLKFIDLIPILSYLLLRGHCRYCQRPLSIRYLLVEILSALAFPIFFMRFGLSLVFFFYLAFFLLLCLAAFTDLERLLIPDKVTLTGIVLGLIWASLEKKLPSSILAMILGGGLLYLIGRLASFFFKKEALGEGDIKLVLMLGAYLGILKLLVSLFLSFLLGAVGGIVLLLLRLRKKEEHLPFAPALALGGLVALFFGEKLLRWYLNLL